MFNPKEWKMAKDLTVGDLILYMRNHFGPDTKVNIDGGWYLSHSRWRGRDGKTESVTFLVFTRKNGV